MRDYHKDKDRYFQMQFLTARDHIIPFLIDSVGDINGMRVLEIGCAEAGVLKAFLDRGCSCVGIELNESRMNLAMVYHRDSIKDGSIFFLNQNIYDIDVEKDCKGGFDIVILKDVIEHIPGQDKIMERLKTFLNPGGIIFFGFPPWQMPFGGHQQICKNRMLSNLPYFHLLPKGIYRGLLSAFGEREAVVRELLELKDTGISIERFERISRDLGYRILGRKHFLFNPIYQYKFNLKPRVQAGLISAIPFLRNYFTTAVYYILAYK